jgi:hypothetical protein
MHTGHDGEAGAGGVQRDQSPSTGTHGQLQDPRVSARLAANQPPARNRRDASGYFLHGVRQSVRAVESSETDRPPFL